MKERKGTRGTNREMERDRRDRGRRIEGVGRNRKVERKSGERESERERGGGD